MRKIISVILVVVMVLSLHCMAFAESSESISDEQLDLLIDLIGYENTAYEIENKLLANGYKYSVTYQIGILLRSVGESTGMGNGRWFTSYQAIDKENPVLHFMNIFPAADKPVKDVTIEIRYSASNWGKVSQLLDFLFGESSMQQEHSDEEGDYSVVIWGKNNTTITVKGTRDLPSISESVYSKGDQIFEINVQNPSNIAGIKKSSSQRSFSIKGGIQFGMSQEDVIEITGKPDSIADNVLGYVTTVSNLDCIMVLGFDDNYLYLLGYSFTEKHSSDNLYVNDFEKVDKMLQEKYGIHDPVEEWTNTLYKDSENNRGFAVSKGDLSITNNWYTLDATITHTISGDNFDISHVLVYQDPWYNSNSTSNSNDDI